MVRSNSCKITTGKYPLICRLNKLSGITKVVTDNSMPWIEVDPHPKRQWLEERTTHPRERLEVQERAHMILAYLLVVQMHEMVVQATKHQRRPRVQVMEVCCSYL
jgi:hypothetical protein